MLYSSEYLRRAKTQTHTYSKGQKEVTVKDSCRGNMHALDKQGKDRLRLAVEHRTTVQKIGITVKMYYFTYYNNLIMWI